MLRSIPVVDVRSGGPVLLARTHRTEMEEVRAACLNMLPRGAHGLVRPADAIARRWLERNASSYRAEIAAIAEIAGQPGVFAVNSAYEWACTVATHPLGEAAPLLVRTLDWPFPGLGRGVVVAHQAGTAGEFLNVTWPGAVGVLTALAPGRFAATINQAPLRRRTRGELLRFCDYAANAAHTYFRVRHAPPAHVLRHVFETARDYREAQSLLAEIPVARPVLFALTGTRPKEACVIERTPTAARVIEGGVLVANDWHEPQRGWEPRSCGGPVETDSRDRHACLAAGIAAGATPFAWLKPPVHNWATRLAVEMSAGDATLRVIGFEPVGGLAPAAQATEMLDLTHARLAA
ncbi:MAG TPA: hypothetical protein VHG27_04035 [Xanthobacteraceae bacterium]|nr:hypothetical protein [Xanthobacteraceae bacterium]